ncbi:hypothetical protein SEA_STARPLATINUM_288 [Streptomyces phage StarPlatinum]|uniref:Uncharacterized protein n=1 Tax=Streptomyces phage StarPlatinum TaxID=2283265 RepID=A0A345M920_9CAUD|nr:hypothetical protein HWB77_gp018 [Streptomyces phage StarPlatinum]YP_009839681.1 hypothetical protein HWB77_gp045 [Streptomyces phage StarPlatinum]AXH66767.1 hypothetical protein SEA_STARPLATINUM_18 [Streptomyces phage StarPlatinum]AXH66991.1 hypothetical protein SEA_STARPLATINUM_288 [Streptomyces phage StarPlatinum]
MERIEIVQQVGNYFPDTKIADALRFAGDIDRGFRRQMEDAKYKAEDEKYAYGQERYDAGVEAGKNSVRAAFDPKVVEATAWAIVNFTERDLTRKITCIKVLRDKFRPLGLIEAKAIMDMIKPVGTTDQLDWPKIEDAEKDSPKPEPELATQSALTALREKLTTNDVARESIESSEESFQGSCPCGCGMNG